MGILPNLPSKYFRINVGLSLGLTLSACNGTVVYTPHPLGQEETRTLSSESTKVEAGYYESTTLTDVDAVYRGWGTPAQAAIRRLPLAEAEQLLQGAELGTGSMRPKVEACIRAATGGVERTHIIDGRTPDALLLEVFTGSGCGTMIVGRKEKATYLGVDLAG